MQYSNILQKKYSKKNQNEKKEKTYLKRERRIISAFLDATNIFEFYS